MAYSNYGMDPNMAADMDRIFFDVLSVMMNNGSIDVGARNFCDNQYRQFRHAILGGIPNKANATGRPIDLNLIQDAVHEFIQNVLTSYKTQPAGYGAMPGGYPVGGMYAGGLGAYTSYPAGGAYGGAPMGTAYHNPAYGNSGYPVGGGYPGAYSSYRNRYPGNGQGCYQYGDPMGPTATQSTNADRYSAMSKTASSMPQQPPVNNPVLNVTPAAAPKVEYSKPQECDTSSISNALFTGTKKVLYLGEKQYMDFIVGNMSKPVLSMRDFLANCDKMGDNKLKFYMAKVATPKVLNAPIRDITAVIQKLGAVVAKELADGNGVPVLKKAFFRFHTEFMKESGAAADAIRKFLIDEFNDLASCGYLFKTTKGHLRIDCLDDIMELFNENTTNPDIKEWQKEASYFSTLAIAVHRAILSMFAGTNAYHVCQFNNPADRKVISAVFADLGIDGNTVGDGFFNLFSAISSKEISAEVSKTTKELYAEMQNRTVILVERNMVYTNFAPAGLVTGDYGRTNIKRIWNTVSNIIEDCLTAGYKALNTTCGTVTTVGVIDASGNLYPFTVGVTTDGNMYMGESYTKAIMM